MLVELARSMVGNFTGLLERDNGMLPRVVIPLRSTLAVLQNSLGSVSLPSDIALLPEIGGSMESSMVF